MKWNGIWVMVAGSEHMQAGLRFGAKAGVVLWVSIAGCAQRPGDAAQPQEIVLSSAPSAPDRHQDRAPIAHASVSLADTVLGVSPQGIVLKYDTDFRDYRNVIEKVTAVQGVTAAAPFTVFPMKLSIAGGEAEVLAKGIDPVESRRVVDLSKRVVRGSLDGLAFASPSERSCDRVAKGAHLPGILVGKTLAHRVPTPIGSCVELVLSGAESSTSERLAFRVIGELESGLEEHDSKLVYIDIAASKQLLDRGDSVTGIEFRTEDADRAPEVAERVRGALSSAAYHVMDWKELNKGLLAGTQDAK